jgi:hypothetical protein
LRGATSGVRVRHRQSRRVQSSREVDDVGKRVPFPTQDPIILLAAVLIGGGHSLAGAVVAGQFEDAAVALRRRIPAG